MLYAYGVESAEAEMIDGDNNSGQKINKKKVTRKSTKIVTAEAA